MAKNSTMTDSVKKSFKITRDKSFKDIIRFKGIAAIVLKFAIPELRDQSLVEIARAIVDCTRVHKADMTDAEILEDEIDFLPSEAGVRGEKQTLNDAVFKVALAKGDTPVNMTCLGRELTVDTEMQNKTTNLGYNLISRAVYYGASLLRDTVAPGDTDYKGIHKVYSVWLCNENLPELSRGDVVKNRYVHTYKLWRGYEEYKYVYTDKCADLIEIVMIELPRLRKEDSSAAELLYKLFNDTQSIVTEIENVANVKLAKARKGVGDMIDYEARLEEDLAEAREEEREKAREKVKEAEEKAKEAEEEAIRKMAKMFYNLGQDQTFAFNHILEIYPDAELAFVKSILTEVYG